METLQTALELERDDDVFIRWVRASSNGFFRRGDELLFVHEFGKSAAGREAVEEGAITYASEIV